MRPGGPRRRGRRALGLWLALLAAPAGAQVGQLSSQSLFYYQSANNFNGNYLAADGGAIYTNNAELTGSGSGETLLLAGLSGDTSRQGPRLDYHLDSNLALLKYLKGSYPTRATGYLDGMAHLKIVPGFFQWIARESYSQVQINPYTAATPANLVSINTITTGPRFTLRPTLRTSITLDALYSYLTTSSASSAYDNFDNHRYGGNLRIERAFSEAANLYLKGHYEKVDFKDQAANNNYSVASGSAGYRLINGRTVLDLSGGYSQVRVYDVVTEVAGAGGSREGYKTTEEFNEPIWAVDISRLITPDQRVALFGSQQFTDAASAFRLGFDQAVPTVAPPQFASGIVFKQQEVGLDWRLERPRTSIGVSLLAYRQRNLLETATVNDRDVKTAVATLARQLSPVLRADFGLSYEWQKQVGTPISGTGQSAKVIGALTDLNWQIGERLALRFVYTYSKQIDAFSANQIGVLASWAFVGAQQRMLQAAPALTPISPASTLSPYH